MPHLSELHGAATHFAVVAVPVYLVILLMRRSGRGGAPLTAAEPWSVGRAHGLFPPEVVTDRDFRALNAWLRTLPPRRGRD